MEDLFSALKMFQSGVRDLQVTRSLSAANDAVQQIKASELDETKQMQEIRNVANGLTVSLSGLGMNPTSIEQVANAFKPPQPTQFEQNVFLEQMRQASTTANEKAKREFQHEEGELNRKNARIVGGMRNAGKENGKPLEQAALKQIQAYDTRIMGAMSLMDVVDSVKSAQPGLMNKLSMVDALKRMNNPKYQSLATEVKEFYDAYRIAVTGMSATNEELKNIEASQPNVGDTPQQFRAKLNTVIKIGKRVRDRYLQIQEAGGRDVRGFKKGGVAALPATVDEAVNASAISQQSPQPTGSSVTNKYWK